MTIDERTWKIVPPELEGAGFFAIRMRAEVEIRRLLLEIKKLKAENEKLKAERDDGAFERREAYLARLEVDQ